MNELSFHWNAIRQVALGVALLCAGVQRSTGDTLSSNLSATSASTETVSGNTRRSAERAFSNDAKQFTADAVTDAATITPTPDSLTLCFAGLFVVVAFIASRRRYRKLMAEFERQMGERWI